MFDDVQTILNRLEEESVKPAVKLIINYSF